MYLVRSKIVWVMVALVLPLLVWGVYQVGVSPWSGLGAVAGHSVEFNLARLSPEGESVGYAIPASGESVIDPVTDPGIGAACNPDGSATFSWNTWADVRLDNRTAGRWEYDVSLRPCGGWYNGDMCYNNQPASSIVTSPSASPQEYGFWMHAGSVTRSMTIVCPTAPVIPTCSIDVTGCHIPVLGGRCTANAVWTASNVLDNEVKVGLVWPGGYEDLWSRYGWQPFGYAPANYNGPIAGFHTPGTYTAKVYDKSNYLCATDTFSVTAVSCPASLAYTETNHASIKNYCDVNNDPDDDNTPPAGMTYPTAMSCTGADHTNKWQKHGPTCVDPSCDCTYIPNPGLPNLQSVPTNFKVVKGASLLSSATFEVGENITFIGSVWNVGTADVVVPPAYTDRFEYRLVGNITWTPFSARSGGLLTQWPASGSAINELGTTTFATAGTYEVRHCADATGVVTESSETDNCSSGSNIVTVTIEPGGGGSSVVQGYHVNESMNVAFANVLISTGAKSDSGNPYQITGLAAGPRTVTSAQPTGFLAQYCEQALPAKDCTQAAHYTTGASVSINLADGETKDIWWRYIPNTFPIDLEVALIGTNVWSTSLATTDAQRHVKLRWNSPEANGGCEEVGVEFDTGAGNPNVGETPDTTVGVTQEPKTPENTTGSKTYQVRCTKDGFSRFDSVTVTDASALPPEVDLRARLILVPTGQTAQLGWTVTNATSCTLTGGGTTYTTTTEFSRDEGGVNPYTTAAVTGAQDFTMTCQNAIGLTDSDTVRVEVTGQWQNR